MMILEVEIDGRGMGKLPVVRVGKRRRVQGYQEGFYLIKSNPLLHINNLMNLDKFLRAKRTCTSKNWPTILNQTKRDWEEKEKHVCKMRQPFGEHKSPSQHIQNTINTQLKRAQSFVMS